MMEADSQETQVKNPRQWDLCGGLVGNRSFLGRFVSVVTRPYVMASGIGLAFGVAAMWLGTHPDQFAKVQEAATQAPQFVQDFIKPWVHSASRTESMGQALSAMVVAGGLRARYLTNAVIMSTANASIKNQQDEDRFRALVLEKRSSDSFLPVLDRRYANGLNARIPALFRSAMFGLLPFVLLDPVIALAFTAPTMASCYTLKKMAARVLFGDKQGNVKDSWRFAELRHGG